VQNFIADRKETFMALHRIKDFDPDYKNHFDQGDLKGLDVYSGAEKVGSVEDILVDESGEFRYLVINTGAWIFGKKVLLPIGRARIDSISERVEAMNLSKDQVEALPEFNDDMTADYEHEEEVRRVYRPMDAMGSTPLNTGNPLDSPAALGVGYAGYDSAPATANTAPTIDTSVGYQGYDRDTYSYDREPDLYGMQGEGQQSLKLYQERLVANKVRQKTGEVSIGKHVETERASVSVPVEKDRANHDAYGYTCCSW
jgi:stress response protein YsnF